MAQQKRSTARPPARSWLLRYLELQRSYDIKLDRILKQASEDAEKALQQIRGKHGIGAAVRRAQITGARGAITRVLAAMWRDVGSLIKAGRADAQAEALDASFDWDEVLLARVYPDPDDRAQMRKFLIASAERNVEAMLARVFGERIELSRQVYKTRALSLGWVDRAINSALARGASVPELAKVVRDMIRPDTPGGVTYAARRLARSEINNAYHAQAIAHNQDKPWNQGIDWFTSRSHPAPDLCDVYKRSSPFPAGSVPKKPHPQCLCYIAPRTVTPEEFEKQFLAGNYQSWIESNYRS